MVDYKKIRTKSLNFLKKAVPDLVLPLPLLDSQEYGKTKEQIVSKALIMNVLVAVSYGFEGKEALAWIEKEHLSESLTERERQFIEGKLESEIPYFNAQVECVYAFAWLLGFRHKMDFRVLCDDMLYAVFPNLNEGQSSSLFANTAKLRPFEETAEYCDLAYCSHWLLRETGYNSDKAYVTIERRRVFEWVLSEDEWDDVSLDT